jgi:hypothetical protein
MVMACVVTVAVVMVIMLGLSRGDITDDCDERNEREQELLHIDIS